MNRRHTLSGWVLLLAIGAPIMAEAQRAPPVAAGRHPLDVSQGRWVYHGHFLAGAGTHSGAWTWHEDCRWSDNHAFMLCSFSNIWDGRHVDSVVVDTYDGRQRTFWHYELFDSGDSAGKPFAARMRIDGNTRTETWTDTRGGKSVQQRIVYRFESGSKVLVSFEEADGSGWKTTATGTGEKIVSPATDACPVAPPSR